MSENQTEPHPLDVGPEFDLGLDLPPDDLELIRDEWGLPLEMPLMTYEQADLASLLSRSLIRHRDQQGLTWHVEVNDPIQVRLQGRRRPERRFPDLYVVKGITQQPSGVFEEDRLGRPTLIVEFSTRGSVGIDTNRKKETYRQYHQAAEYVVFDITEARIEGRLVGWRLDRAGEYRRIPTATSPEGLARLHLRKLGLDLGVVPDPRFPCGFALRAFLPGAEEPLLSAEEATLQEKDSALQERDSALQERDSALQEKDSALQEKDSALQEKDSALLEKDSALQRLSEEKGAALRRAEELAAEVARMEDELRRLRSRPAPPFDAP